MIIFGTHVHSVEIVQRIKHIYHIQTNILMNAQIKKKLEKCNKIKINALSTKCIFYEKKHNKLPP